MTCYYLFYRKKESFSVHFLETVKIYAIIQKKKRSKMPPITCHILDTTKGKPADEVTCALYYLNNDCELLVNENSNFLESTVEDIDVAKVPFAIAKTNQDGRIPSWIINKKYGSLEEVGVDSAGFEWKILVPGIYKIRFHVKSYFLRNPDDLAKRTFFPFVDIHFVVSNPPDKHYHIPLLLSNNSYTTYRGS